MLRQGLVHRNKQHRYWITLSVSASNFDEISIPSGLAALEIDHGPIILSVSARMTE
jgi:hypothetical protein